MSFSLVVVSVLIIALLCGAGQRILDKMRLSDRWALIILFAIAVGIVIPPIKVSSMFTFSIGGFLIPFMLCIYMLVRSGWSMDLLRAVIGTLVTAGFILLIQYLMPSNTPEDVVIDNTWLYGIVAGLVAYILGRSRRNAFVCSVLGILLASMLTFVINIANGAMVPLKLGLGGAFDSIVLSILISVGLSEAIGTTAEFVVGKSPAKAFDFESGEFVDLEVGGSSRDRKWKGENSKRAMKKSVTGIYKKQDIQNYANRGVQNEEEF